MTKALDYFDPAYEFSNDFTKAVASCESKFLVISFSSDWRFSPARSREIVRVLLKTNKDVSYVDIVSALGHDSFLLPIPGYHRLLKTYFERIADGH